MAVLQEIHAFTQKVLSPFVEHKVSVNQAFLSLHCLPLICPAEVALLRECILTPCLVHATIAEALVKRQSTRTALGKTPSSAAGKNYK